jgi:hypothetical protein
MKYDYRDNDLFHRTYWGTDAAFWEAFGPVLVDNYMLRCVQYLYVSRKERAVILR